MANVNNPHGLRPTMRTLSGGAVQAFPYLKAAGNTNAIYKHDPVTLLATGFLGDPSTITPGTTPFLGVVLEYSPASAAFTHTVIIAPDAIFEAEVSGAFAFADIGQNANLTLDAGGTITRDNSGARVDSATMATTATLDVKLLGLYNAQDNAFGANARVELRFNKHLLGLAVAGV